MCGSRSAAGSRRNPVCRRHIPHAAPYRRWRAPRASSRSDARHRVRIARRFRRVLPRRRPSSPGMSGPCQENVDILVGQRTATVLLGRTHVRLPVSILFCGRHSSSRALKTIRCRKAVGAGMEGRRSSCGIGARAAPPCLFLLCKKLASYQYIANFATRLRLGYSI